MLAENSVSRWKIYTILLLTVGTVIVWSAVFHLQADAGTLLFIAFDVGQGDALFIQSESGAQILIDGGPDDAVLAKLGEVMPFWDHSLDVVILTHPDADHLNGLVEVLKRYEVDLVLETGVTHTSGAYEEWRRILKEKKVPMAYAIHGRKLRIDERTKFHILSPLASYEGKTVPKTNNTSIIARLDYGEVSFLLTGDAEQDIEKILAVLTKNELDTDILKVGHHGSKTSTSAELLAAVTPDLAVMSVGKHNRYGHPHEQVVSRLEEGHIPILRTDIAGDVRLRSDGEYVWIE